MKYIISIIVPVYNVEKYLNACLESIVGQTIFKNIEVILINDGSKDSSRQICEKYKNKYSNIILIDQDNKGVSSARNVGIEFSKGEYLIFIDSDDILEINMCEKLLNLVINNNSDIATVDFSFVRNNRKIKKRPTIKKTIYSNKEILKEFFIGKIISKNIIDKIFKRQIIADTRFDEKYKIGEDYFFLYNYLKKCNSIVIDTSESLYNYIYRENSAMNGVFSYKFFDTIELSKKIVYDQYNDSYLFPYAESYLIYEKIKVLEYIIISDNHYMFNDHKTYLLRDLKQYGIYNAYKYFSLKRFLSYLLIINSFSLYKYIYNFLMK